MKQIHVHFLGIGGSGASAVANIAKAYGFKVTGCDKSPLNEFTRNFDRSILGEGHSPNHLQDVDILAVTPAIFSADPDNQELKKAKENNIKIMTWQQFMGEYLEKDKFVLAVCGTHGKSTITAMIGLILEEANLDPTVELGAIVPKWGANFRAGKSKYFVTEADEFNDNFLVSHPDITIITSVQMDHPEYFKDFNEYKKSFIKFLSQTKYKIIANMMDDGVKEVMGDLTSHLKGVGTNLPPIVDYSKNLISFPLKIPGEFNISNASAAYQLGLTLGIDKEIIKLSLSNYQGISRRFEYLGKFKEALIYSDFAHHPTEVKVNLEAIRLKYPDKKIIVFFQPHMYSRTKALWDEFVKVFQGSPVDKIYLLDIYYAREDPISSVSSQKLVQDINNSRVGYLPNVILNENEGYKSLRNLLDKEIDNDVLFFMGAGSIDSIARKLAKNGRPI